MFQYGSLSSKICHWAESGHMTMPASCVGNRESILILSLGDHVLQYQLNIRKVTVTENGVNYYWVMTGNLDNIYLIKKIPFPNLK